ncbi:LysR family transcriptional regulator [Streptomyces longisporoflavus]|uniref:LysR family transcriptional regulator n=1 Tax=Streptomyces longisporoflavus TaxID=28044 RepID=UPI00167EB314|nr:LysR family transcriptional regulator [Streptomyces longisporoflavus]GGV68249.1 LysR family transcriptional regulator [Streptomyces longisporoflavus]
MDVDLRLVRYFTVVAEYGNFGRAATKLHLAQPSLSRQIQRLEAQLGVRLFDRTPQGSSLTDAGQAFLPGARTLLHEAEQAARTARAALQPPTITVGCAEGLVITACMQELRRRHPDSQVRTRHLDWRDTHALAEGRIDALVAYKPLPFPADGLRVTTLHQEPRVLATSASHHLAHEKAVSLRALPDEELVACASTPVLWSTPKPAGDRPAPPPPAIDDSYEDKLELIATGHCVAIFPASDRRAAVREDIALVPVTDIDPCELMLATRAGDPNPLLGSLEDVARTVLGTASRQENNTLPVS